MKIQKRERISIICKRCGVSFGVFPSKASSSKFCSRECSSKYFSEQPTHQTWASNKRRIEQRAKGINRNIFVCKNCGKAYIRWRRIGEEGKEYCSRECFFAKIAKDKLDRGPLILLSKTRSLVYFYKCVVCGKQFTARFKNKQHCSKECKNLVLAKSVREKYREKNGIQEKKKLCDQCGKEFIGWDKNKFCSHRCSRAYRQYMCEPRHRARALGVYYEPVNPLKVFTRDGWRCQRCNKKLNPKNRGKMQDNAPELDHILPWAQGGEHSYQNTQLLCRKCNGEKGSQPMGQMLLFGYPSTIAGRNAIP